MKRLALTENECMACAACETACAQAFYKSPDTRLSCVQVRERKGKAQPVICVQCGKCAKVCEAGAITQNAKGVYMLNKAKCTNCGKCVEACTLKVLIHQEGQKPSKCISCALCVKACPMETLYIREA